MNCYFFGNLADDVDEHVPPKALFKGYNEFQNQEAMKKGVLQVKSCRLNNSETSMTDNLFAYLIVSLSLGSIYASNVSLTQCVKMSEMFKCNFSMFIVVFKLTLLPNSLKLRKLVCRSNKI